MTCIFFGIICLTIFSVHANMSIAALLVHGAGAAIARVLCLGLQFLLNDLCQVLKKSIKL